MGKNQFHKGDEGFTSLIGKDLYPKEDARLEALGTLDEFNAVLGLSRSFCKAADVSGAILELQQQLYAVMGEFSREVSSNESASAAFADKVRWLEEKIEEFEVDVERPKKFIIPGDTPGGAALDIARTVCRRAERRVAGLVHQGLVSSEMLRYLNRLSSFLFILELSEYHFVRKEGPTLAK